MYQCIAGSAYTGSFSPVQCYEHTSKKPVTIPSTMRDFFNRAATHTLLDRLQNNLPGHRVLKDCIEKTAVCEYSFLPALARLC
jgi:hypothetical protein